MQFTHSITIMADRHHVYAAIADLTTWPDWMPDVSAVEPRSGVEGPEVGAAYGVTQHRITETYRILELVPTTRVVVQGGSAVASAVITYTLSDAPEYGTHMQTDVAMEGLGGKVIGAVFAKTYREQVLGEALGLKDYIERA